MDGLLSEKPVTFPRIQDMEHPSSLRSKGICHGRSLEDLFQRQRSSKLSSQGVSYLWQVFACNETPDHTSHVLLHFAVLQRDSTVLVSAKTGETLNDAAKEIVKDLKVIIGRGSWFTRALGTLFH